MDLLFLGTSAGVPTKNRNVTALALQPENSRGWYLFDCGEATQHRLQRCPLTMNGLRAIFITHAHGDHCYGLPGLLASGAMTGRKKELHLLAPRSVLQWLEHTRELTSLYIPFEIKMQALEDCTDWADDCLQIEAVALSHRVPCWGYAVQEVGSRAELDSARLQADGLPPGPEWGQIKAGQDVQKDGKTWRAADYMLLPPAPRKVVIGGDNDQPQLLHTAVQGAQVLVHEATYTEDIAQKVGSRVQHSSAQMLASFADEAKVPNLIMTHISPRYLDDARASPSVKDLYDEARACYSGNLLLAKDLQRYRLDKHGVLQLLEG